jgi:serine phosphatase RsbU (regulator of sigma subunit)
MLAGNLAMFSVVAVLVLRFARSRRDEERLEAELAAARAVQHVLITDKIPAVPGFHIDCAYRPAGDVGGDFFQILPLSDGDALVVIGDVSGKGLPAAMTVSLLVGMVHMLALSTQSPAEILAAINQNMMGRTSGGFTTCLILHIKQSGAIIAANAGHIPPYLNGRELRIENGLPLGLDGGARYRETTLQLSPEGQVTLLTDGVVEARTPEGELFGFDRVASINAQSAAEIAEAAQQFGQQDDITVLSLTRQPSKEAVSLRAWSAATA